MLSDRIAAAKAASIATRGPRKGHLKASCPPMGTDAAVFWQAAMMACNPHKVSIMQIMLMPVEQRPFYDACLAWCDAQHSTWKVNADLDRANLSKMGVW